MTIVNSIGIDPSKIIQNTNAVLVYPKLLTIDGISHLNTYTKQYGRYKKQGNIIHYTGHIIGSDFTGSGQVVVDLDAPSSILESNYQVVAQIILVSAIKDSDDLPVLANLVGFLPSNSNKLQLYIPQGRGGFGSLSNTFKPLSIKPTSFTQFEMIFSLHYEI